MSDSDTFQTQVVGMAPHAVRAAELEVDILRISGDQTRKCWGYSKELRAYETQKAGPQ